MSTLNERTNSNLFSRKKMVLFSLSLIFTIAAIAFSVAKVVNVNIGWIIHEIGVAVGSHRQIWLILLVIMPIYFTLFRFLVYWNWIRMYKIKVWWYDWIIFSLTSRVLGIITPLYLGAQPFHYFWLRTNKLPHFHAVSMMTCASFIEMIVTALITWPSFIYLAIVRYDVLITLPEGKYCFYLIIVGMFLDLTVTSVYFLMGFSRHFHIFFSSVFNKLASFLHIRHKSQEQIYYEYKQNAIIKKQFIKELKHVVNPFLVTFLTLGWGFIEYSSMFFSLELIGNNTPNGPHFTYMQVFNSINVATTANNFIPIPGGEGTTQFSVRVFLTSFLNQSPANTSPLISQIINGGILVWRFFSNYLQIFVWLTLLPLVIYHYVRKVNQPTLKQEFNN